MKIEWEMQLNIKVNGIPKPLYELSDDAIVKIVEHVLTEGLRDKADGEFEYLGE